MNIYLRIYTQTGNRQITYIYIYCMYLYIFYSKQTWEVVHGSCLAIHFTCKHNSLTQYAIPSLLKPKYKTQQTKKKNFYHQKHYRQQSVHKITFQ